MPDGGASQGAGSHAVSGWAQFQPGRHAETEGDLKGTGVEGSWLLPWARLSGVSVLPRYNFPQMQKELAWGLHNSHCPPGLPRRDKWGEETEVS